MKMDEYGMYCCFAVRSAHGVTEHGPLKSVREIPQHMYKDMIWISLQDHDRNEVLYIRGPRENGDMSVQIIFQKSIDYEYSIDGLLSQEVLIEIIEDSIDQFKAEYLVRLDRLMSIKSHLV
jgi:hypothetical protein